jgi:hypothetical protein
VSFLVREHIEEGRARLFKGSSDVSGVMLFFRASGFCSRQVGNPWATTGSDVEGALPLLFWSLLLLFWPSPNIWVCFSTVHVLVSLTAGSFAPGSRAFLSGDIGMVLTICPATSSTAPFFLPWRVLSDVSFAPRSWTVLGGEDSVELVICPGTCFCTTPFFPPLRKLSEVSFALRSQSYLTGGPCLEQTICCGTGGGLWWVRSVPGPHIIQKFCAHSTGSWWQLVPHLVGTACWIG